MRATDAHDGPGDAMLAIDTATSRAVVAIASADGTSLGETSWVAGHRHGETLLPELERLLDETGVQRSRLTAIVVGTGPGTFTGLRVGIATAKGLAEGLGIPIVGVSTATGLLSAAARDGADAELALLLPAGPQDRVFVQHGVATHLPFGTEPDVPVGTEVVAVDLDGRAPPPASARGEKALRGLGAALLEIGGRRLAAGDTDDLAGLVPEYVNLPRGVVREMGEEGWSEDRA